MIVGCTETPLKEGMSAEMSGDERNERKYEQMSEDNERSQRDHTSSSKMIAKKA